MEKKEIVKQEKKDETQSDDMTDTSNGDLYSYLITNSDKRKGMKKVYIICIVVIVLIFSIVIIGSNWNKIMGNHNCKTGNYEKAVTYYAKDLAKSKLEGDAKDTYDAILMYLAGKSALASDDMDSLANALDYLQNASSKYPTEKEIKDLQDKYAKRANEIDSYNETIKKISEMFADTSKIADIKSQCDELLKKSVTTAQKTKIEEIKKIASAYVEIKGNYDKGNNEEVVKKVSEISGIYQNYLISKNIEEMKNASQKVLDERKIIDEKLKTVRDSFNGENFDSSLSVAEELLTMNLTEEERKEVEIIKSTSEQKVAEAKAAAEQEAKEARQKLINEAIHISATALYDEFSTNNVGAENKYKGKMLVVTGTVYNIDKTFLFGEPYVNLTAGYVIDGVTAYFSSSSKDQLTNISQGQTISVLGKCTGRSFGSAILNDCSIVN